MSFPEKGQASNPLAVLEDELCDLLEHLPLKLEERLEDLNLNKPSRPHAINGLEHNGDPKPLRLGHLTSTFPQKRASRRWQTVQRKTS